MSSTQPHKPIVRSSDEHAADPPLSASIGFARGGGHAPPSSPHSAKFRAVTGGLVGLAVAALVIAVALLARGGSSGPGPRWSSWRPQSGGASGVREIADHLAPLYRISGVDQLAVVTVANLASSTASSSSSSSAGTGLQIAVRPDPAQSSISLLQGHTIAFDLCGIGGSDCSIAVGAPSADRLLLLRREALELALYTFKYISSTDNVVALLPPGHTTQTSSLTAKPPTGAQSSANAAPVHIALLFLHDELKPFLDQPVMDTLPLEFPPLVSQVKDWRNTQEAALVEQVTARGMFAQHLSQAQDGSNLIVLDPLPPQ
jgi:hypothetical protein